MNANVSAKLAARIAEPTDGTQRNVRAFTVVELVAVLATLAALAGVFVTSFASTRPHTYTFQCMNNLRQLSSAWRMYADENRGGLVFNSFWLVDSTHPSWVGGSLNYSSSSDNTNTDLLINNQKYFYCGYLGPYFKSAAVFKCPADKSVVPIRGQQLPRVRSVSMNSFIGTMAGSFNPATRYRRYSRIEQIKSPSNLFLLVDEREDSINEGAFLTGPDTRFLLLDFPANYHDGAANLVFVDGHSEIHKWQDSRTMPPLKVGSYVNTVTASDDPDIDWIDQHATELR
jgi:prepilin-type processing-associated H-X9-DG protein